MSSDMPFRDTDAVLHEENFRDCSIGSWFSAEGHDTKAFLHESGHAVFNMADEYDGNTNYFEPNNEPNGAIALASQLYATRNANHARPTVIKTSDAATTAAE